MGLLKRASYANFGYEDVSYLRNSKTYLERLKNITTQMRDYREPFNDGYEGKLITIFINPIFYIFKNFGIAFLTVA